MSATPDSRAGRAVSASADWRRALAATAAIERDGTVFPVLVEHLAERHGAALALAGESDSVSYRELAERAAGYAGWALRQGIGRGDVVGVLVPNCPDYLALWLGITRIGAIAALLNTRLRGAALAHAIGVAAPKHLVIAAELAPEVVAIRGQLAPTLRLWSQGRRVPEMAPLEAEPAAALPPPPGLLETALYIYTSGTTGLPKAARVSHRRIMQWSLWFSGMMDTGPEDRLYDCLPMYHSVGGIVAIGAVLARGGAVVLRRGFSAQRFWDDIAAAECTLLQYIGELCRYLVAQPPQPREREHRLRLCCGNGLRAGVWEGFAERFHIPRIIEFYASTEGNFSLFNCDGRPGAIGRIPGFLRHRAAVELIEVDQETGLARRGADGFCRRCAAGDTGEAIGRIGDGSSRFDGYSDDTASAAKILRDVFARGDAWYRSGDLMRRDADGFFFFVDRLGDSFRWKGENISAAEVEAAIAACPGVKECVAYGVTVPGHDGRAGMAAIVAGEGFDPATLWRHLERHLAEPAHPVFLRLVPAIAMTATFKPVRHEMAAAGCDPAAITDPLYVGDRAGGGYVALDRALHARICAGAMRL